MVYLEISEFLFQHRNHHPMEDYQRAFRAHMEWKNSRDASSRNVSTPRKISQWLPPPPGWLKCNFDASFNKDSEVAGVGWIIRNSEGVFYVLVWFVLIICYHLYKLRLLVFFTLCNKFGFGVGDMFGLKEIVPNLSTIINSMQGNNAELGNILHDIRHWISLLPLCSLEAVNRERNAATDALSKQCRVTHVDHMYLSSPPPWLIPYLYWPYTVFNKMLLKKNMPFSIKKNMPFRYNNRLNLVTENSNLGIFALFLVNIETANMKL